MSMNSRAVSWLVSWYRSVLRHQYEGAGTARLDSDVIEPAPLAARNRFEQLESRLLLSSTDIFDIDNSDYLDPAMTTLTGDMLAALEAGLDEFGDQLEALSQSGALNSDVPGVLEFDTDFSDFTIDTPQAKNLLDLLEGIGGSDLSSAFNTIITSHVSGLPSGALLGALNFAFALPAPGLDINASISGAQVSLVNGPDEYELTFDVNLSVTDTESEDLFFDLGRNADQFGITNTAPNALVPNFTNEVNVAGAFDVSFSAGLSLVITEGDFDGDGDTPDTRVDVVNDEADFFVDDAAVIASAESNDPIQHFAAAYQLGFLEIGLLVNNFDLNGAVTLALNDGNRIAFNDIDTATTTDSVSGTIDADITVVIDNVANFTDFADSFTDDGQMYTLHFTGDPLGPAVSSIPGSEDNRAAPIITLGADTESFLEPFNNVDPGAIIGAIDTIASRLGTLPASSVLGQDIPLTDGLTLGELFPLTEIIKNGLLFDELTDSAKLVDGEGNPLFKSAQALAERLAAVLHNDPNETVKINPTFIIEEDGNSARKVLFTVEFDAEFDQVILDALQQTEIGFDIDLGEIGGLSSDAVVQVTPEGKVTFTFGVDLVAGGDAPIVIAPPILPPSIIGVRNALGDAQTSAQLTNIASFKLTVGGLLGGTANVFLSPADTAGNLNVSDLADDLQTAINSALTASGIDFEPEPGRLLVEVGLTADDRLTLSSTYTTFLAVTERSNDAGGFEGELGFLNNQQSSIASTPTNGILGSDAIIELLIGSDPDVKTITVLQAATLDNGSIQDLVDDINDALMVAEEPGVVDLTDRVEARRIGTNADGIMLRTVDGSGVDQLQIVSANDEAEISLGWLDKQINAEIAAVGRNELIVTGDAKVDHADFDPGTDITFEIIIGSGDPILVTVGQTLIADDPDTAENEFRGTAGNTTLSELVDDINLALAQVSLADGRLLGTIIGAGAIDTDRDATDGENDESLVPDTIILRSLQDIPSFSLTTGTDTDLLGFNNNQTAAMVGPDPDDLDAKAGSTATFTLTVGDLAPQQLSIAIQSTLLATVNEIQAAIDANSVLSGVNVTAGQFADRLVLTVPDVGNRQLRISLDSSDAAGVLARDVLGLQDGFVARAGAGIDLFVQDANITATVDVDIPSFEASATLGFVGIDIDNTSNASATLSLDIDLFDNANSTSRISLGDLDSRLTDIVLTSDDSITDFEIGSSGNDVQFDLVVDLTPRTVVVPFSDPDADGPRSGTEGNSNIDDLIKDIQDAVDDAFSADPYRIIVATDDAGHLTFSISAMQAIALTVNNINAAGASDLHLTDQTGFSLLSVPDASWTGDITFAGIDVPNPILGLDALAPFDIAVGIDTGIRAEAVFDPDLSLVPQDLLNFADLKFFDPGNFDVLDALEGLSEFLTNNFNDLPFVGVDIPVVGLSIGDLLGVADVFETVVSSFADNPTATVQLLEQRLLEALGLPSLDPGDKVKVVYDAAEQVLLLDVEFSEAFNKTLPVNFDLDQFSDVPFELRGAAGLEVEGGATSRLAVGIDLSTPASPELFIDADTTAFELTFAARGMDLNFIAGLGPAGLNVADGQIAIDGDGDVGTTGDSMGFSLSLNDADGRISFNELASIPPADINASVSGALNATLPVFFPDDTNFLGNIELSIPNLEDFLDGNVGGVSVTVPDLNSILTDLDFNIFDNLPLLIDGFDFVLGGVQDTLGLTFGDLNLPLMGNALGDAADFLDDIRDDVFNGLRNALDNAIEKGESLITDGLEDIFNSLGILKTPIVVDSDIQGESTDFVEWNFQLGDVVTRAIDFDLGLPALGLESDDPIEVSLDWMLNVGIGLDFTNGFYFVIDDAANSNELMVTASVDLPDLVGNLVFLRIEATDNNAGADAVLNFAVDLFGTGGDGKLSLGEFGNLDANIQLNGGADVNLGLRATVTGPGLSEKAIAAIPAIAADFILDWDFDVLNPTGDVGTIEYLALENIGLDLGSFLSEFLLPIVDNIQDVTGPIQPFIDAFTAPIPVISDLAGEPFTLLDLAALFGDVNPDMIKAIADLITLVNTIPTSGVNLVIPFGSVVLQDGGVGTFDLFDDGGLDAVRDQNTPLSGLAGFSDAINGFTSFEDAVDNGTGSGPMNDEGKDFAKALSGGDFGDFIDFPLFNDPSQIIGALFGRPFVFVTLDLPPFEFGFEYSQFFPIIGPLGASITGGLGAKFDFAFGYDSFGLSKFAEGGFKHPLDLFRGFFISDGANADGSGADVNEIEVTGSLTGAAELNLGIAKGGVGGGVDVTFGLNLDDPDDDGRVRIEEILNNLKLADPPFNPLAIFDINILVEAKLTWFVEVLYVFEASGQIGPSLPLLDLLIEIPKDPVLATKVNDQTLRLNMGPFSGDRLRGDVSDGNETFEITDHGGGDVTVSRDGVSQDFSGITEIEVFGGQGNDSLTVNSDNANSSMLLTVDAGFGDDTVNMSGYSGTSFVLGGSGNDVIDGGSGVDTIDGGAGADTITGGDSADMLSGGTGNDTINGDDGEDMIFGNAGDDILNGNADADYIDGGDGADTIHGNAGNDTLSGGNDKDEIFGDEDNDTIGGGAAADRISGGLGADTIYGDSTFEKGNPNPIAPLPMTEGGDIIWGEAEAPVGGDGDDLIFGEGGNDFIRGDDGNDTVFGSYGFDIIFGDNGNDELHGEAGGDIIFGGADNDSVFGEGSNDVLFGDDGLVVYVGFPSFNGVAGNEIIGGNRLIGDGAASLANVAVDDGDPLTRDLIVTDVNVATDGNDTVDGAAGNDIAFGGAGDDRVIGDIDPDLFTAINPTGNDLLFGDGGRVFLSGRLFTLAETVDPADGGIDTIFGSNGDDIAFGGAAGDFINGGHGTAFVTTASDADVLIGDSGRVEFTDGLKVLVRTTDEGVGGIDTIGGNENRDIAMGGADGDFINGHVDTDVLIGDEGIVEIVNDDNGPHIVHVQTNDTDENKGGVDDIEGDTGDDVILGGVQGDKLKGSEGEDVILGDEGFVDYDIPAPFGDGNIDTIDHIETDQFHLGGDDMISGADNDDIVLGGSGDDMIFGDNLLDDAPVAAPGEDILIGDQGRVTLINELVTHIITTDTQDADGGMDAIFGNEQDDIALGGVDDDFINGNTEDDILLGDEGQLIFNLLAGAGGDDDPTTIDIIETLQPALGGMDIIQGNEDSDIAFGGAAGDFIYGDADTPATGDGDDTLFGDGGRVSLLNGIIHRLESTDTAIGGADYIEGNAGNDTAIGGIDNDEIHGDAGNDADVNAFDETDANANDADGNDILLGDNGLLNWIYQGDAAVADTIEFGFVFDDDIGTLDLITTIAPNDGGMDLIFGNAGDDLMFGGTDMDLLVGDNTKLDVLGEEQFGQASTRPGEDLQFGDHGRLYPQHSFLPDYPSRNFFAIDIGFDDGGAGDLLFGNEEDDVQLGQQGDDLMFGGSGDDDMIGGHNVSSVFDDLVAIDEFEMPTGTTINDFLDGDEGDDAMAGDNAQIWRNGDTIEANDLRQRFHVLDGETIYDADGLPNFSDFGRNDPLSATHRSVFLLDHSHDIETDDLVSAVGSRYGNDIMAGDAGDDAMFGQLGSELMQGDGSLDDHTLEILFFEGVQPDGTVTDGHDYMEGNGGGDMMLGNLGQDDMVGGSSDRFGLDTPDLDEIFIDPLRPDSGDIIFGGAATAERIARHAFTGDVNGDNLVFGDDLERRHAVDSDFILGDNGNISRIVLDDGNGNTTFDEFNYDQTSEFENRGDVRIVVRAYEFLDYDPFQLNDVSIGDGDVIRGESGDDFIHGMTGDDIAFGDADDDDVYGERDHDWLSGGTGDDGMLGDNGLILTSRNSIPEPLYGVEATTESFIETPGDFLMQELNVTGELKKTVDLEPFDQGGHDVMYGGLGDDNMHGGAGNDGMSGAEALPDFYNHPADTPRVQVADLPEDKADEIRILPIDGNGNVIENFYDFTNALAKIEGHFLNFENDLSLIVTLGGNVEDGGHFDPLKGDGEDILFGDWDDDWLVGGTGRDHMFGGMGADIINSDDDLETNGGLNDQPDNGNLIPGHQGAPEVYDNSDIGFGGGGRDLLIANTGADRHEDWGGEFNSFQQPFAPHGNGHNERQVPPHTFEFFYALGESDGADQTRIGELEEGRFGDPERNGEPYGELGLVIQKDRDEGFNWKDQHGKPIDRQAGNTPGGKRDNRGDGLSGGTKNVEATTSATDVIEITLEQTMQLALGFWASKISGIQGVTFSFSPTLDLVSDGLALNEGTVLTTMKIGKEYSWQVAPI